MNNLQSELVLWRHAEAEGGLNDLSRALTRKGRNQAGKMAAWLGPRLPDDTRILVSPAVRTQQTVLSLARAFETVARIAPGANAADVLSAAHWPHPGVTLVVGHQPTLGAVAATLLGMHGSLPIRKGAIWWLMLRERNGFSELSLRAVLEPGLL
jgi:phosphohistidine phosphatase